MINTAYTVAIEVSPSPGIVFNRIIQLSKWWVEEFAGEELKLNSEFILKNGDEHFSKNKVIEFVPGKKFVWVTTESKRRADNFDWTGTKMIFELSPKNEGTRITFTYDGVVPEDEQDRLKEICDFCIRNLLYNYLESFMATIEVRASPQEVFKILTEDVSKWWGGKDLSGRTTKIDDEFVVHHKGAHYSKQKLTEVIPGKKVEWHVTESSLYWLQNDKQEWTNTKMIFEINAAGGKTILHFAHYGLVPSKECYEVCRQGWTMVITDWLFNYITEGKVNARFL
ncbi:MAG TPA: SRPBCC family protein [Chitinophagaceae bacterium]|nr:SRPBCC family protein [Chitinophagaceae bacterium]